jgi:hypothetical protein
MKKLIAIALLASLTAGCSSMNGGTGLSERDCTILAGVLAGRRAALEAACANAKDPLTDDKCLALDGINAAIAACMLSASEPPAA